MSTAKVLDFISAEDYLEFEKTASVKHEYVHGRLFALAGASDNYNRVAGNVFALLWGAANRQGCRIYISDMKVRIPDGRFYYPDVMTVCQDDVNDYYKENPCLIIEVRSRSTSNTDRREKAEAYFTLPSLTTYLMIDSQAQYVEGYLRTPGGWKAQTWRKGDEVAFGCLETSLNFSDIYAGLEFE